MNLCGTTTGVWGEHPSQEGNLGFFERKPPDLTVNICTFPLRLAEWIESSSWISAEVPPRTTPLE
jgi:hypothetical protein